MKWYLYIAHENIILGARITAKEETAATSILGCQDVMSVGVEIQFQEIITSLQTLNAMKSAQGIKMRHVAHIERLKFIRL